MVGRINEKINMLKISDKDKKILQTFFRLREK